MWTLLVVGELNTFVAQCHTSHDRTHRLVLEVSQDGNSFQQKVSPVCRISYLMVSMCPVLLTMRRGPHPEAERGVACLSLQGRSAAPEPLVLVKVRHSLAFF